jgi:heterotetrameric sarcosine oxidase gamma subunit
MTSSAISMAGDRPAGTLERRSALAGVLRPGRIGFSEGEPGIVVSEPPAAALVHVHAYRGDDQVGALLAGVFELTAEPVPGRVMGDGPVWALKLSTLDWLVGSDSNPRDLSRSLQTDLADRASVTEVSHARTLIRIQGPRVRSVLAQGISLDLHDQVFPPGAFAQTRCGHLAVLLLRGRSNDHWDLMVHSSYAVSLWEWVLAAGASVGVEIRV